MSARKHYCGIYKGLRIYQEGEVIGFNWYGIFYAAKKRKKNYVRINDSESRTFEEVKRKIKDNKWGEQPQGT